MTPHSSTESIACQDKELSSFISPDILQGLSRAAGVSPDVIGVVSENTDAYHKTYDPENPATHCEVFIESRVTLEDIAAITPPSDMATLRQLALEMKDKRVIRINATAAGGGVAIMNAPWVHIMRMLGVDAHWHALKPAESAAKVTKGKFHNVLQDVAGEGVELTEEDKVTYEGWIAENKEILEEPIRTADVIIIDDWQPSGLIPYIKGYKEETENGTVHHLGLNPRAKILFRDHIHTEGALMVQPGTPQSITWDYLWNHNRIKDVDVFITHPKDEFVPPNVPIEKVVYMPATCDLLDDLNRPLTTEELQRGYDFINQQLAMDEHHNQTPLDLSRPYLVLIARFDESKGMPQGIEAYAKARQKMQALGIPDADLPQFVVLGNGSVDDPSGIPIRDQILELRATTYTDIKDDLKVVRVPHNDMAINTLVKGAQLSLQPSIKEGLETRVTDAILQGVPVIGSNRGGIPLQIVPGESGYVIDPLETDEWAERIVELMTNKEQYSSMRQRTRELALSMNYKFTTVRNIMRWLWLSNERNVGPGFIGNKLWVDDHIVRTS